MLIYIVLYCVNSSLLKVRMLIHYNKQGESYQSIIRPICIFTS